MPATVHALSIARPPLILALLALSPVPLTLPSGIAIAVIGGAGVMALMWKARSIGDAT